MYIYIYSNVDFNRAIYVALQTAGQEAIPDNRDQQISNPGKIVNHEAIKAHITNSETIKGLQILMLQKPGDKYL